MGELTFLYGSFKKIVTQNIIMHLGIDINEWININEWIRLCGYAGWLVSVSHRNVLFDGVLINACAFKVKDLCFFFMYGMVRTKIS